MAEPKTKPTNQNPRDFLNSIEPEQKRIDSLALLELFEQVTGEKAIMWGTSIVGFGTYHYKSERSTQEGDWPLVGFSPRKQNLTLYVLTGFSNQQELLDKVGKHTTGKACLYIKRLADIEKAVLEEIITASFQQAKKEQSESFQQLQY